MLMQERMSRLPELVAAAKRVIENVDSDALLSYFGMKTDLRQGAPIIKVSVPPLLYSTYQFCFALCRPLGWRNRPSSVLRLEIDKVIKLFPAAP